MKHLPAAERSIYLAAVPLMAAASLIFAWLLPFPTATRWMISLLAFVGVAYTVIAYRLRTRSRWKGLRYTTPLVTVTIITIGLLVSGDIQSVGFVLYFPAVILSSIRSGRRIGLITAVFCVLGYYLVTVVHSTLSVALYDLIFVAANLLSVAALSGAMADEERALRRQAQERHAREQAALLDLANALINAPDLSASLEAALQTAAGVLAVDAATIITCRDEECLVEKGWGLTAGYTGLRLRPGHGTTLSEVVRRARPLAVTDLTAAPHLHPWLLEAEQGVRSVLAVPLVRAREVAGVFMVHDREPRAFSADDRHLLALIADQSLVALQRGRAEERTRWEAARATALARVAGRLNAQLDLSRVVAAICEEAAQALSTEVVAVELVGSRAPSRYVWDQRARFHHEPGLHPLAHALFDPSLISDEPVTPRTILPGHAHSVAGVEARGRARALATTYMRREGQVVGRIAVATTDEARAFSHDERSLLDALADHAAQAITNAHLYAEAQRRLAHLRGLRQIDTAITTHLDLDAILPVILEQVTAQLGVDAATVSLFDPTTEILWIRAALGFRRPVLGHRHGPLSTTCAGRAILSGVPVHVANLAELSDGGPPPPFADEQFIAAWAVPLTSKGLPIGALEVFHRERLVPDQEWLDFLESLAGQTAIAIDNVSLLTNLQQLNGDLVAAYETTLEGWSRALDLRDHETEGHTQRVTKITVALARRLGFDDDDMVHLRRGALLHDIGKMGIPDHILLKPGPLTHEEWEIMRQHPVYAYQLLEPISFLKPALDIPYYHHERWNGSGYPHGLVGEAIPLAARIFAVVDVWDALRSDRPYRRAWPEEEVRAYLRSNAAIYFDPNVVNAFFQLELVA